MLYADRAEPLMTADTGSTTADDLDDLDGDLSEVCMQSMSPGTRVRFCAFWSRHTHQRHHGLVR